MQKYIWYMLRVENWHRVIGIEPNKIRFAVVGHIF